MKKDIKKTVKRKEFEILPLSDTFELPTRAKIGSVGYDLTVPEDVFIPAHSRCVVPLKFAINIPYGIEAKIEPRSDLSISGMVGYGVKKINVKLLGFIPWSREKSGRQYFDADVLVGKIDPNYTDEVNVIIKNNDVAFTIKGGTRIAQMSFYNIGSPFLRIVDKLTCKSRGGGLGSSGTHRLARKRQNDGEKLPDNIEAPSVSSEMDIASTLDTANSE